MERRDFLLKIAAVLSLPLAVASCKTNKEPKRKKKLKPGKPIPCPC